MTDDIWNIALRIVTPREAEVLKLRFGVEDGRTRDYGAIARILDITRIATRHMETYAIQRLRKYDDTYEFADHLEQLSAMMNREAREEQRFLRRPEPPRRPFNERPRQLPRDPRREHPRDQRRPHPKPAPVREHVPQPPPAPKPPPEPRKIDPSFYEVAQGALPEALLTVWAAALDHLTDREIVVLRLRFGLADGEQRSAGAVARKIEVTRKRAHQLEENAISRLLRRTSTRELGAHFEQLQAQLNLRHGGKRSAEPAPTEKPKRAKTTKAPKVAPSAAVPTAGPEAPANDHRHGVHDEVREALIEAAKALIDAHTECSEGAASILAPPLREALSVVEACVEAMLRGDADIDPAS